MHRRMAFRGERLLSSQGHLEMAEAYDKSAEDPRLTSQKCKEYRAKARRARELAEDTKVLERVSGERLRRKQKRPV
jgi:hypothetical protein